MANTPLGMNRITTTNTAPNTARPITGELPVENTYNKPVMATAPTAGPAQYRVPPSTLISTTVSGTVMLKVSPTVT